jgi:hypothetical protein
MLFKNYIDASQETMTNGAHDHTVMFVLAALALVEGFEIRVMLSSDRGGKPQSTAQVDGTPFAQMCVRTLELPTLMDRRIKASKGDELLQGIEAMDVADLAQDGGSQGGADTGNGGEEGAGLLEQVCELLIKGGDLVIQQSELVEGKLHLLVRDGGKGTDAQRGTRQAKDLVGLVNTEVPTAGLAEGEHQVIQRPIREGVGGDRPAQQGT